MATIQLDNDPATDTPEDLERRLRRLDVELAEVGRAKESIRDLVDPYPRDADLEAMEEADARAAEHYDPREPEEYRRLRELEDRAEQLRKSRQRLEARHAAAVDAQKFRRMAEDAHGRRVAAVRVVEQRVAWTATASIGALGSLGVAGRLADAPASASTAVGGYAAGVLFTILLHRAALAGINWLVEFAATIRPVPGRKRLVHHAATASTRVLPFLAPAAFVIQLLLTALLARHWLLLIGALSGGRVGG